MDTFKRVANDTYYRTESDNQMNEHDMKNYQAENSRKERKSKNILLYVVVGFAILGLISLFF